MSQRQTDVWPDWWLCTTHKLLYFPPHELFLPHCVILSAVPDCHPSPCHRHRHYLAAAANLLRLTAVQTAMLSWLVNAGQLQSDICAVTGRGGMGCWCVKLGGQGRWWRREEEEEDRWVTLDTFTGRNVERKRQKDREENKAVVWESVAGSRWRDISQIRESFDLLVLQVP